MQQQQLVAQLEIIYYISGKTNHKGKDRLRMVTRSNLFLYWHSHYHTQSRMQKYFPALLQKERQYHTCVIVPTAMRCFCNASILIAESRKDTHTQNLKRKNRTKIRSDSSQQQDGSASHAVRNCTTAAADWEYQTSPDKSVGCVS